jgi:hypothetical protein
LKHEGDEDLQLPLPELGFESGDIYGHLHAQLQSKSF